MNVNLPVWKYYPENNAQFIDPLYVPYQKTLVRNQTSDPRSKDTYCEIYPWKNNNSENGMVHKELVRKGWGLDFHLMHPDKDPCPIGWVKAEDGSCVASQPEFGDHGFYSSEAHVAKYQYHDGYTTNNLTSGKKAELNEFDMRSVHPLTGNHVNYHPSKPAGHRTKYGRLAVRDYYLA